MGWLDGAAIFSACLLIGNITGTQLKNNYFAEM